MTSSDDPFEEAAHREHADRLRREARLVAVRDSIGGRGGRDPQPPDYSAIPIAAESIRRWS